MSHGQILDVFADQANGDQAWLGYVTRVKDDCKIFSLKRLKKKKGGAIH